LETNRLSATFIVYNRFLNHKKTIEMNEDKRRELLDKIEAPLSISLSTLAHRLPANGEQINEALQILMQLREQYTSEAEFVEMVDSELIEMLETEEKWLNESVDLILDQNALPKLLIDQFKAFASLKLSNGNFPGNSKELENWRYILSLLKDLNPTDNQVIEDVNTYEEFLGHYDGNAAYEYVLDEISTRIYSKEGENGSISPANKEELLRAMFLSLKIDDFDDFTDETKEQIKMQHEGFDYLLKEFNVSNEDIEAYKAGNYSDVRINENEQLQSFDGLNGQAYQFMDEMYNTLSYVDKEGNRYASSPKEIEEAATLIHKAEEATEDKSDKELQELIIANKEHLEEARVRKFAGAWWLIIAAGIMAIIELFNAFSYFGNDITSEVAVQRMNTEKNYLENTIKNYEAKTTELTKDQKNYLEDAKEELKELNEMKPEKYAKQYKRKQRRRGMRNLLGAIISVGWVIGYYLASRPYGYDRFKRQKQYAVLRKATGWTAKILTGILGVFWSIPITTYITKYTDGSEERSNDALGVLAIQLGVTAFIIAMVLFIAKALLPILTIIAYVRNYPGKLGAKQVNGMFKESKGFIERYIDKIKGKKAA